MVGISEESFLWEWSRGVSEGQVLCVPRGLVTRVHACPQTSQCTWKISAFHRM